MISELLNARLLWGYNCKELDKIYIMFGLGLFRNVAFVVTVMRTVILRD
jgi:hypothetical protein